ncbi:MAG TPA: cupin domain-containing protein [Ktedonobacteraceae bacterium]|jgi:mannose-6-phosphate isomerase-like protein (cupin superfamily)|nr:cupin domain-containing protein [Ktedonobacteraceae bacterium]
MRDAGYGETRRVPAQMDVLAPDGSEIRLLANTRGGSSCHCTLPVKGTSFAGIHRTVEEIWYCLQGQGQIWRKKDEQEGEVALMPGVSVSIPQQTQFQFRNTGSEPLVVIITTMPPWPGAEEWVRVEDHWSVE